MTSAAFGVARAAVAQTAAIARAIYETESDQLGLIRGADLLSALVG